MFTRRELKRKRSYEQKIKMREQLRLVRLAEEKGLNPYNLTGKQKSELQAQVKLYNKYKDGGSPVGLRKPLAFTSPNQKTKKEEMLEQPIVKLICDYLSLLRGGFVIKHELSGKPVKVKNFIKLVPFKNKYYRRGLSDIEFLYRGKTFYFEVKTNKELKWWAKKYPTVKHIDPSTLTANKDKKVKHFLEQQNFLDNVNRTGNVGRFVDSLEMVKEIIKDFT